MEVIVAHSLPLPDDVIVMEGEEGEVDDEHFVSCGEAEDVVHDDGQYLDPESWHLHILQLPMGQGRCVPCNKVFKRFQAAKRHFVVMHQRPEIVECCYCGQRFNTYAFRTHINSKHGVVGVKNVVELYGKRVD